MKLHLLILVGFSWVTLVAATNTRQAPKRVGIEPQNPLYGPITVYSKPEKAIVYVDGVYLGRTPLNASVARGQHFLQIFKYGYKGSSEDFNNSAGTRVVLSHSLISLPGEANFAFSANTELTNAVISNVDSSLTMSLSSMSTVSPGNWKVGLKTGNYAVNFIAKGKYPVKTNFYLSPGDKVDFKFTLVDLVKKWTLVSSWGKSGSGDGEFNLPQGLAAKGDKLLIADSGNARLQLWTTNGQFKQNIALSGEQAFSFPVGVSFNDQIIITDQRKNRLVYLKPDFSFDQFSSPSEPYRLPAGLDFSANLGLLAFADSDNMSVRLVKAEVPVTNIEKYALSSPLDVKWQKENLWVSDWGNKRIVMGTTNGDVLKTLPLDYAPGMISFDPKGNLYVPDTTGSRIQIFDNNLKLSNTVSLSNVSYPGAILYYNGRIYITARDSHQVLVLEEQ